MVLWISWGAVHSDDGRNACRQLSAALWHMNFVGTCPVTAVAAGHRKKWERLSS